jgi:hypothetical protein
MDSGFGWREVILLGAIAAGIYLIIALFGLARTWKRERPAPFWPLSPREPTSTTLDSATIEDPPMPMWTPRTLTPVDLAFDQEPTPIPATVDLIFDELPATDEPVPPFAATLANVGLEAEVRQLRAEVAALRQDVAELKEKRRISPLYADAAALAHRGFDAHGVAEECGISVAEAELVMAMSRDEKDFDSEVEDGPDGRQHDAEG